MKSPALTVPGFDRHSSMSYRKTRTRMSLGVTAVERSLFLWTGCDGDDRVDHCAQEHMGVLFGERFLNLESTCSDDAERHEPAHGIRQIAIRDAMRRECAGNCGSATRMRLLALDGHHRF